MGPGDLHELLHGLGAARDRARDPAVLVGTETGDDAGVFLLPSAAGAGAGPRSDGLALVQTADFITPPFDDPFAYGQIAAANALSDVYAMGGRPVTALNLCAFPRELLPEVAHEILEGAAAALAAAGAALLGGHTVRAPELFFGLAVTGLVDASRIWRNIGVRPGDVLLLTKPLGAGLLVTGARKGLISEAERSACAVGMAALNRRAAEILGDPALDLGVHAATDVTGFGLAGHGLGMTQAAGGADAAGDVALRLHLGWLPLYPGARALAERGVTCGGAQSNQRAYRERITSARPLTAAEQELLFDPQTSGGLLCALPAAAAERALLALHGAGIPAARIGEVVPRAGGAPLVVVD
ncbi:MAG: selenide, water dikinase SelD [Polyangia bacterium]